MTSAAVNNTAAGKAPLNNKTLGIGMVAFAVICLYFKGPENTLPCVRKACVFTALYHLRRQVADGRGLRGSRVNGLSCGHRRQAV